MTQRWLLEDVAAGGTSYRFEHNPDKMTSPLLVKSITSQAKGIDGKTRGTGQLLPHDWQFSGVLHSQAQHDALLAWVNDHGQTYLTDHLSRRFLVRLKHFVPVRAGTRAYPWRHTYTCDVTTYKGPL